MTSKDLNAKLQEVKQLEKRLKLLKDLKKTIDKMHKLNDSFDLNCILLNNPKFEDDFYLEVNEIIKNIETHPLLNH